MAGTTLTPDLVDKLLDKLATDDGFRDLFVKEPAKAMQQIGAAKDFDCGVCKRPKPLATKAQFKSSRDAFRKTMLGSTAQVIFMLDPK
jgi:putative modified peptide